ncbi:sulfotransferase [Qipengyuania sp. XHP0207]|uniref:sulfotransferase n=1 Tax=Qipengyuania sp. XHP0207 TaxID=3038078 RepID=UPI00241EFC1B|nr:sulfotransferase [Qipengyuania sp. XHP0207]MDG5747724.1 sulfotransferase [Qipengyuania sp. XHP0207]
MKELARPPLDFIVIGAIKAATTWLQVQLQHHPQAFMPDIEPHFFSRDHGNGWEWYRGLFPDHKETRVLWGEKTADYLANPQAAARIAAAYPDIKLVVQFRNPVDRAYSDYKMLFRRGHVSGDVASYLDARQAEMPRFLDNGLYAHHLDRWFDEFDRRQMLVFLFEDVKRDPQATLVQTCQHLGIAPHYDGDLAARSQNDSSERFLPLPIRRALAPLKPIAKPLRGHSLFERTRGLFAREIDYPPLDDDLRSRLQDFYHADIQALERLIGRDLSHWLQPAAHSNAA